MAEVQRQQQHSSQGTLVNSQQDNSLADVRETRGRSRDFRTPPRESSKNRSSSKARSSLSLQKPRARSTSRKPPKRDQAEYGDDQRLLNDSSECDMRRMLDQAADWKEASQPRDMQNYMDEGRAMDPVEKEERKRQLQKLKKASKKALQKSSQGSRRSRSRSKSKARKPGGFGGSGGLGRDTTPF